MVGIKVGEALKTAGVPEDLFSHKKRIIAPMRYEISETAVSSTNMRTQIAEYYARETGIYFWLASTADECLIRHRIFP